MPVIDQEVIVVSSTPIGITSAKLIDSVSSAPKWAQRATFYVEDAPIRMSRMSGVNPNNGTKTGVVIPAGTTFVVEGYKELVALRMIRSTGVDASVYVELEVQ